MSGVKELGHLVLYVGDVGRSADFYRDVLGWHQVFPEPDQRPTAVAAFSSGRTHHELLLIEVGADAQPLPAGRHLGLYHFGLKVGDTDDQLREALARVEAAGATVVGSSDHGVTHSLYILDPDGNEVELYIDVADVDWRADPAKVLSPIRPCASDRTPAPLTAPRRRRPDRAWFAGRPGPGMRQARLARRLRPLAGATSAPRRSDMADQHTRPDADTRQSERAQASAAHEADRSPTPDEEADAERGAESLDPDEKARVAEHYQEMVDRGVHQEGEGKIE